jgi:intracellular septation protein
MKQLFDFLPLALFFLIYKVAGNHADASAALATHWLGGIVSGGVVGPKEAPVLLATVMIIVATALQVAFLKATRRKVDLMLWITLFVAVVFGGLSIYFHSETFIKWKPSIVCWAMGLVFWGSQTFFHSNLPRATLGKEFELPDSAWQRLNFAWVAYFGLMGLINLWVAYSFSTDAWASFHTFGSHGLSLAFFVGQFVWLSLHLAPVPAKDGAPSDKPAP